MKKRTGKTIACLYGALLLGGCESPTPAKPIPSISSIYPSTGPTCLVGQPMPSVTLTGANFRSSAMVRVDGVLVADAVVKADGKSITFTLPEHCGKPGLVNVEVQNGINEPSPSIPFIYFYGKVKFEPQSFGLPTLKEIPTRLSSGSLSQTKSTLTGFVNTTTNNVDLLLTDEKGTFFLKSQPLGASAGHNVGVAVAALEPGNGLQIAVLNSVNAGTGNVRILQWDGTQTIQDAMPPQNVLPTDASFLRAVDWNQDNKLDFVVGRPNGIEIYANQASQTPYTYPQTPSVVLATTKAALDVAGMPNPETNKVNLLLVEPDQTRLFANLSTGMIQFSSSPAVVSTGGLVVQAAAVGQGTPAFSTTKLPLVALVGNANGNPAKNQLIRVFPTSTSESAKVLDLNASVKSIVAKDIDQDGNDDFVMTEGKNVTLVLSQAEPWPVLRYGATNDVNLVNVNDFDQDGRMDVMATETTGKNLVVLLNRSE